MIAEPQRENVGLRELIIRLARAILNSIGEQREFLDFRSGETGPHVLLAITPDEIIPLLRDASIICVRLSRGFPDRRLALELEGLSAELASEAQRLEHLFSLPPG